MPGPSSSDAPGYYCILMIVIHIPGTVWYDTTRKKIFYWSVQFTCQTARRQIDFIILCKYMIFTLVI